MKNSLDVSATLVSRGFVNKEIVVQLLISSRDSPEEVVVDEQVYTPSRPYEELVVKLKHTPTEPGQYRIKVRAVGQPTEVAVRNNERPSFLTVYDGGLRVLYLEGNLGDEQRRDHFVSQNNNGLAMGLRVGNWKLQRYHEKFAKNHIVERKLKKTKVPQFQLFDRFSLCLRSM